MALTLADKITLVRLGLMPLAVGAYLWLPIHHCLCFWVCGWLCAFAEISDYVDGKVARARGEVSDFGKLADPFCDVIYRIGMFLVFLLPAAGVGYPVFGTGGTEEMGTVGYTAINSRLADVGQLVFLRPSPTTDLSLSAGLVPWFPVFLMVIRELIAGALRAMTAARGLVLAARTSGKIKAWFQGATILTITGFPAFSFHLEPWHLTYAYWATWACAVLSVYSIAEHIWVNRQAISQLAEKKSG